MNRLNRRDFLRTSGLAITAGAVLAACGNTEGPTAAGRLGNAEPNATLPPEPPELTDADLMRTAQSVHHTAIDGLRQQLDAGNLTDEAAAIVEFSISEHEAASAELSDAITAADGEPFECANEFFVSRYVQPAVEATKGSDDPARDALAICLTLDEIVARTEQEFVLMLAEASNRPLLTRLAAQTSRRAVALAMLSTDQIGDPVLDGGEPVDSDADGFPIHYPVPDRFGQVTALVLMVGPLDDEGARFSVNVTTPAANSYIFTDTACPASDSSG